MTARSRAGLCGTALDRTLFKVRGYSDFRGASRDAARSDHEHGPPAHARGHYLANSHAKLAHLDILPARRREFQPRLAPRCRFAVHRPGHPALFASIGSPRSHGMPCRGLLLGSTGVRLAIADTSDYTTMRREGAVFSPRPKGGVFTPRSL